MHELEPFYSWRHLYMAEDDERSPFYGRSYSEFQFSQKIYNYYIHPQWDEFGSPTLYLKILFADYEREFAIIEMIGEWNDCIHNDIMFFKREIIDKLIDEGINQFILIGENVLNFHSSDDCYYEEWYEDIRDEGGWIVALNFREHVLEEMMMGNISYYVSCGADFIYGNWRTMQPEQLYKDVENKVIRSLPYSTG